LKTILIGSGLLLAGTLVLAVLYPGERKLWLGLAALELVATAVYAVTRKPAP
jgi:hypothetical protein